MKRRFVTCGQSVAIGEKHFEVVKKFVYLGSLMTPANDVSLDIQRWIQTANRCFFGLRKPWSVQSCSTAVRRRWRPKGRRTNCSYLRGRFSKRYAARKSKMVARKPCHEDKQIALVRWSEDPKTYHKEKSRKTEIQVDGMNSDSLALGVRDWTHCAQDKFQWNEKKWE
jgi:hypothetical protein